MVRLMGGLGNQMFQYATGKSLAVKLGVPLRLDTSFLEEQNDNKGYTLRNFELDVFNIDAAIASKKEVDQYRRPIKLKKLAKLFPFAFKNKIFSEKKLNYQKEFELINAAVYLEGYWQTEKYFTEISKRLRENDFNPKSSISKSNAELLEKIKSSNSVSIHVRRGDYISNPETNKFHGTCTIEYYEQAVELLNQKTKIENIYVFSDEPEWVKANIKFQFPTTYIENNNGKESHWDLFLMRHCKHNVIANSSFSWWGAWLNENSSKTVIAPKKWFNDTSINTDDLLPVDWLRL